MRRPLKPFVTEYKATNRRPKDGAGVFGAEPAASIAEAPARNGTDIKTASPKAAPATRRGEAQLRSNESPRYNGGQPEDSYEAAMRAADALFSGASSRDDSARHPSAETHDVVAKQDGATQPGSEPAPAGTGRILRVLDEEPNPVLLDMEAERAPKRRGRKPGSKNKPKIADDHAAPAHDAAPDQVYAFESRHDHSGVIVPRVVASKVIFFPPAAARGGGRFAWVRTKLRPGEAWKRRLPKVIW